MNLLIDLIKVYCRHQCNEKNCKVSVIDCRDDHESLSGISFASVGHAMRHADIGARLAFTDASQEIYVLARAKHGWNLCTRAQHGAARGRSRMRGSGRREVYVGLGRAREHGRYR